MLSSAKKNKLGIVMGKLKIVFVSTYNRFPSKLKRVGKSRECFLYLAYSNNTIFVTYNSTYSKNQLYKENFTQKIIRIV